MTGNPRRKYLLFSMLYFAQGSVLGYFASLNALYLRSHQIPMAQIGIFTAVAMIPLVLKIFWGILSDRLNFFGFGHRKPYIFIGLVLQATGQFIFPFIDPVTSFPLLIAAAFLTLTGMSLYDTCTDGLALDTTTPGELGKVQGIMVAGRAAGIVIISAAVGWLSHTVNWNAVFIVLGIMTLLPAPLLFFVSEPAETQERTFSGKAFRAFGKRMVITAGLLGLIGTFITGGTNQLVNPFLKEHFGISYLMAGLYSALWGLGVTAGGITGGRLIDRYGNRRSVVGALMISMLSVSLLAAISSPLWAWPLLFLFGIAYGYFETVFFATSMSVTDHHIAASMFAILMALSNVGSGMGMLIGGWLSDEAGFRITFLLLASMNLLMIPLLPFIASRTGRD